ncbi:VNN1-like protein, partial [Mya arenaria]
VKFLITVGTTICPEEELLKFGGKALLKNTMLEFEIHGLDHADARKLLSATSHKELDGSFCEKISKEFNGNPKALKVAGIALRDFPDCSMNAYPSIRTLTLNSFSGLLQNCFDKLQPVEIQYSLLRLSVFRTNWFDVHVAVHVLEGIASPLHVQFDTKQKTKKFEAECAKQKLTCLENRHFIEADKLQSFTRKGNAKENQLYSLHSIVLRFLHDTCEKTKAMQDELEIAKEKFLWYFCKKFEHYGKENYSSPVAARIALEMNKPHVELFFKLLGERGTRLEDFLSKTKKTKASTSSRCEYVMSTAEFACVPHKRMYFAENQSQIVKNKKQLFEYIYWKSKEAECLLACDRTELAFEKMSGVFNDFRIKVDIATPGKVFPSYTTEGWQTHLTDELFSLTRLYKVFGQALFHIGRKEKNKPRFIIALKNLEIAQAICDNIQHLDIIKKLDRATIQNLIGCVHFELGDVNKALTFHEKALEIVAQDLQFTKDRCHTAIVEYQSNIAACEHQLGLNTKNEKDRRTHFGKAMEMYNKCIDNNKRMGRDNLPPQKEYEKAIADGEKVRRRCLSRYVSPHTELTMAYERLANYKFKLGKRLIEDEGEQVIPKGKLQKAKPLTYRAAVYEHKVILPYPSAKNRLMAVMQMMASLKVYEQQAEIERAKGVDIMVFPEDGIYGYVIKERHVIRWYLEPVPDPKLVDWIPCDEPMRFPQDEVQVYLSCRAKRNNMYVVANMGDIKKCHARVDPNCKPDGFYQFNSNVAYDRHRKFIAKNHVVTDIGFPTAWSITLPYCSAIGYTMSFSVGHQLSGGNIRYPHNNNDFMAAEYSLRQVLFNMSTIRIHPSVDIS